ncbi:methyltransferase-like protein 25B [Culicoides brevitarsis]|uniref:methyltransferase-like protein 25B n=1 Tax=Culicoides brevitarsis TaxID=469753 RepID=UPI00307C7077
MDELCIRHKLETLLKVYDIFKWIVDAYVLDFLVCDYWNCLPSSFKALEDVSLYEDLVSTLLSPVKIDRKCILPLSLLAVKKLDEAFCLSRAPCDPKSSSDDKKCLNEKIKTELEKRIKPKKLHEIQKMVKICDESLPVRTIIDFGSGLGHLSRHLQYKLGIDMTCIEQNCALTAEARKIDENLERKFRKNVQKDPPARIFHMEKCLKNENDFQDVLMTIKNNFNPLPKLELGLIGLHPCGDLAVLLLKSFLQSKEVKFLNIVGCCYMKLTTEATYLMEGRAPKSYFSYPLSQFLTNLGRNRYNLSYEALESATHAKEKYLNDIKKPQKTEFFKINSYRATIETLIVKYFPEKRHSGLKNVRYEENLTFKEYCKKALSGSDIKIPQEDVESEEISKYLKEWKRVVIFYLLRLVLSPFIESILLYDRMLFLMENGCKCELRPVFDPLISPRCHVMSAIKNF